MRATITDKDIIESVSPLDLAAYLRGHGWVRANQIHGGLAHTWNRTIENHEVVDVLVPVEADVRDFSRRVAETLQTLEAIENRSQLEILADLQRSRADVLRWRWIEPGTEDGTIPLELGQALFTQVRNQMLAAACSVVRPSQYFPSRKPVEALEYMRQVRLGQSERGSYVVSVQTSVPPRLGPDTTEEEPFSRKVSLKMLDAFRALRDEVVDAGATGDLPDPMQVANRGVSANFCESVAAMLRREDGTRSVEIQVGFASSRPILMEVNPRVRLSSDQAGLIEQIGKSLRESATREAFELQGFVTQLNRDPEANTGTVSIHALVDEQYRRVEIEVASPDYDRVLVPAHGDRRVVSCVGELERSPGRGYRLRNAREWTVVITPE
jgi:hypothetical protein